MRGNVRPPGRFADAAGTSPQPKNRGKPSPQKKKYRKNNEAVDVDLTEPQDPFSILRSSDKKDLISTVGQHLMSSRDADTKEVLEECTKRLNMKGSCKIFDIAKVSMEEANLNAFRK